MVSSCEIRRALEKERKTTDDLTFLKYYLSVRTLVTVDSHTTYEGTKLARPVSKMS